MANTTAHAELEDSVAGIREIEAVRLRSPQQALMWWIMALRLWRRAPLRLMLLCLTPIAIEALVQIIPIAGMVLSKVVVQFVPIGILVVFDRVWRSGRFSLRGFLWSFRREHFWTALLVAFVFLSIFVFQMVTVFAAYGYPAVEAVVFGRAAEHREFMTRAFTLVLILPGMVPGTLLMFLMPLVVFDGVRPLRAAGISIRLMASSPASFLITCAVSSLLLAVSLTWAYGLLMLAAIPWMNMMIYAAYRDVFPVSRADE